MSKATYLLTPPTSIKPAAARRAKEDGVSLNQWIATAVAQKVGAVETAAEFFKHRAAGHSLDEFDAILDRVDRLRPDVPVGMTMADLALRFILESPDVSTIIPGMRRVGHVEANLAVSDGRRLDPALLERLRRHRWKRTYVVI